MKYVIMCPFLVFMLAVSLIEFFRTNDYTLIFISAVYLLGVGATILCLYRLVGDRERK